MEERNRRAASKWSALSKEEKKSLMTWLKSTGNLISPSCRKMKKTDLLPDIEGSYWQRYLPIYLPTYLPTCLPACLPVCLPACLPAYLPTCLPACLPACLPTYLHKYYQILVTNVLHYLPNNP